MASQKPCNLPECPISPEFWETLGEIKRSLVEGDKRMDRIERKLDGLNGGGKKGAGAGAITGVLAAVMWVWLKERLGIK